MAYIVALVLLAFIGYFLIRFNLSETTQKKLLMSLGGLFALYFVGVIVSELFR